MARKMNPRRGLTGTSATSKVTIRELVFIRMVVETAKYLDMKSVEFGDQDSGQMKVQRGIVRGMALAMTKMYGNGYEPYWAREVKSAEKAASMLAREWMSDGRPGESDPDRDGWWLVRRDQLWRSRYDQSAVR